MALRFRDSFSDLDSPVHGLDPRTKLILALTYVIIVVSTPTNLLAFVIYAGLLSWVVALARIPLRYVVLRAALVLPISVLAAFWMPFLKGGTTVSWLGLQLSEAGLWLLAGVAMKSFLGASTAILLTTTTPFNSLVCGLRKLGVPAILADALTLTYRYLFLLADEALRLSRAAAARGYRPRWLGQAILIGRLVGQLFLRSYERAERIYGAMIQRGYRGQMPPSHELCFRWRDLAVLVILIPTLLLVRTFLQ